VGSPKGKGKGWGIMMLPKMYGKETVVEKLLIADYIKMKYQYGRI